MTETFAEYSRRLLSLSEGTDPQQVMASTPSRIGALIAGSRIEELQVSPGAGRWSVAQIVSHLADAELVFA